MRAFALPTRIDGCIGIRDNISIALNMTMNSTLWNETLSTTTLIQTIVKYVEI